MNKLPETKNNFLAIAVILFSVGLMPVIFGTNVDQEKYAREHKIDNMDYLKFTCQSKSICKNYAEIRLGN